MSQVSFTGRVARIYADKEGCFLRIDPAPDPSPKSGYFRLELDHPNYGALYALAVAAAANGFPLTIRSKQAVESDKHALVSYLVMDT